jgi:cell division septation protein DedD
MGTTLAVLHQTSMPAALLETGFMDVLEQARQMLDPTFQTAVAEAVAKGICACFAVKYVAPAPAAPTPAPAQPTANMVYSVQVGSFVELKNAEFQRDKLIKAGYKDAYIIQKDTAKHTYKEGV